MKRENQQKHKGRGGHNFKDLTGRRFGRLVVIGRFDMRDLQGRVLFACICDCGRDCVVSSHNLLHGRVKSCGCLAGRPSRAPALFSDQAGIGINPWDLEERYYSCLTY